jgi:hypothetical protein
MIKTEAGKIGADVTVDLVGQSIGVRTEIGQMFATTATLRDDGRYELGDNAEEPVAQAMIQYLATKGVNARVERDSAVLAKHNATNEYGIDKFLTFEDGSHLGLQITAIPLPWNYFAGIKDPTWKGFTGEDILTLVHVGLTKKSSRVAPNTALIFDARFMWVFGDATKDEYVRRFGDPSKSGFKGVVLLGPDASRVIELAPLPF